MEIKEQIKLRFKGVDFPGVQLKSSEFYNEGHDEDENISIDIKPQYFIPEGSKNTFKIIVNVDISATNFSLSVVAIGSFELSEDSVTEDERKSFINANSTAIVFPYVRAFISNLTSNLGKVTKPIILPAQFFNGRIEEMIVPVKKARAPKKVATPKKQNLL